MTAQWPSGRQSPVVPNRPTLFNSHMPKACNVLRWKPLKRKGKTASPSSLPVVQPYGPAPQRPWVLVTPLHLLLGNVPLSTLLNIHPPVPAAQHQSAPLAPHPTAPMAPGPSAPSKW